MGSLSIKAQIYILSTIVVGTAITGLYLQHFHLSILWGALTFLAVICQVFKVEGTTNRTSYNIGWLVYGFSLWLLGAQATLAVILIAHLMEWIKYKYPWYVQLFNMANFALSIALTDIIFQWINPTQETFTAVGTFAALAALAAFTLANHLQVGLVIWFARNQTLVQSGVFRLLTLLIDFTLISLGAAAGVLWVVNPTAVLLTLPPIYLFYTTLKVPALERKTEIDQKTGLYNSRYFTEAIDKEFHRAERFDRSMTVVFGDLDLLRNINNTYGHLAGDVVLCGIAKILSEAFQGGNVVARFGGEEFAILMPEITVEEALPQVEQVRTQIEAVDFAITTSVTPIKATISFGIAGRSLFTQHYNDIIHNADVALYNAKLNGRNRTAVYNDANIQALFTGRSATTKEPMDEPESPKTPPQSVTPPGEMDAPAPEPEREENQVKATRYPDWSVNAYIGVLLTVAVGLAVFLCRSVSGLDWIGLLVFGLAVILTEGLSVEIYVKNSSVSTSAAPFIAGSLLLGPVGALLLSLILASTAMFKNRSRIQRFLFNFSNHLISSFICVGLVRLIGQPITQLSILFQVLLASTAGILVYASSTILISGVMGLSMNRRPHHIWLEEFSWLAPFYLAFGVTAFGLILGYHFAALAGIFALILPMLVLRFSQIQYINRTKVLVNQLRTSNSELEKQSQEIASLNEELLLTLANIIDLRDPYTWGHSAHVAKYAVQLANELALPAERIELIRKGSLLHDIGKLGIREEILFKKGALTKEEYLEVQKHASFGSEILEPCHILHQLIPLIRHHHERYDGKGYPDQLKGQTIPVEASIICLADSIEAMASDRPYRKALELDQIVQEIQRNAGTQFKPLVVNAMLKVLEREGQSLIVNSSRRLAEKETISAGSAKKPALKNTMLV